MDSPEQGCEAALRRISEAHAELGYPKEVVSLWSLPHEDASDLWNIARESGAGRVLEVGTFVGTSALLLAHALPDAQVHSVDPNLPLQIEFSAMGADGGAADLGRRTLDVARCAADRLGLGARVHFHAGGFSIAESFALADAPVPVIGAALCAREGPFDLVFVDGLHFEDAVAADVRLALSALAPGGVLALHDAIGYWGSHVRRALGRILEADDSLSFEHAPYYRLSHAMGTVSRAGRPALQAERRAEQCFTDVRALADHLARLLRATFPGARFEARDPLAQAVVSHLAVAATDAPRVVVALDPIGEAKPGEHGATLGAVADRADAVVLGFTPPGEVGAAGPWDRPLARHVGSLSALGFDCHDLITPFLEPYTHPFGGRSVLTRRTSFLIDSVVAVRRGSRLAAPLAGRAPLSPATARALTDQRLQMLFASQSYLDMRARYVRAHDDAAALGKELDRHRSSVSARDGSRQAPW